MKEIRVRIAHHAVAKGRSKLVTIGLGSCVAIAIHDRAAKVGGLAHILLPDASLGRGVENRARYASSAVPLLLEEMKALGAEGPFCASLVGGAALFGPLLAFGGSVGARNVDAARAALGKAKIALVAEDVGGQSGRTVLFDVTTGKVKVKSVRGGEHVL
ncbi:MAG TPA: chemotaxis protein CheD [Gemmatimonadaceae bacterium]|nr:chemotaxis protein CheD [Gemmatimonadaceae bacterium]